MYMTEKRSITIGAMVFALACGTVLAQTKAQAAGDLWLQPAKGGYTVEFVSDQPVAGLQFDVKGIEVTEGQFDCGTGLPETHVASCSINADGNLRVGVFSMNNSPIPDSTIVTIRRAASNQRGDLLSAARAGEPMLDGVLFADAQAADITPAHLK